MAPHMASRPPPERRLEAVFESEEQKRRCVAAAAAVPMHASRWAAQVLVAAANGGAGPARPGGPFRGVNSLRIAALRAQTLAAQIDDPAHREQLAEIRDLLVDGLAGLR